MNHSQPFMSSLSSGDIARHRALAEDYQNYCRQEASKHFMAVRYNLKNCQRCGHCCLCYPCTPKPAELKPVAKYLNISIDELIAQYMVADTADCVTFFLRWAKEGQEDITGARIPPQRTYDRGYCIFYDKAKKGCKIHPVRPLEARYIKCWDEKGGRDKRLWGMSGWKKDDIYKLIPDFNKNHFRNL